MKLKTIIKYILYCVIAYVAFFGIRLYSFFDYKDAYSKREARLIDFYKNDLSESLKLSLSLPDTNKLKKPLMKLDSAMIEMLQYTNRNKEVITYNYDISQTILFMTSDGQFIQQLAQIGESDTVLNKFLLKHRMLNEEQIMKMFVENKYTVAETYYIFTSLRDDIRSELLRNNP